MFLLLFVSRGMDFLSTWVATPNMVLEGNPIAKKLGWKWGIPLNVVLCFGFAFWPLPAIVISTTSVLVAARNFQSAWLMRSLGEQLYRDWHVERVQETSITLYLSCLFAQTGLTGGVGAAGVYFSEWRLVPLAIGLGIVAYALAVAFYSLLGIWRLRRSSIRAARPPATFHITGQVDEGDDPRPFVAVLDQADLEGGFQSRAWRLDVDQALGLQVILQDLPRKLEGHLEELHDPGALHWIRSCARVLAAGGACSPWQCCSWWRWYRGRPGSGNGASKRPRAAGW